MSFTIERRYIGRTDGVGLLDKWHIPWQQWHVYQTFETEAARDKRLHKIVNDTGWHVDNLNTERAEVKKSRNQTGPAGQAGTSAHGRRKTSEDFPSKARAWSAGP